MNAERELYSKQAESIMAQARKIGVQVMDLKDLDKLSSEQLAKIEAASLAERQRFLEDELQRLRVDIAMYEKMLDDLSKHAQSGPAEEQQAAQAEEKERSAKRKVDEAAAASASASSAAAAAEAGTGDGKPAEESADSLLEHQAELQEELATVNGELKALEDQLGSLEDRMKAVIEDTSSGQPSVVILEKKKTLLQYKVNRVTQEKRRLERQLSSLREIHAEEKKLVEALDKL